MKLNYNFKTWKNQGVATLPMVHVTMTTPIKWNNGYLKNDVNQQPSCVD
jgi:hypothetical protein